MSALRPTAKTFIASLRAASRLAGRSDGPAAPSERPAPSEGGSAGYSSKEADTALEPFRRSFVASMREIHRPSGAIVFVSGTPNPVGPVAQSLARASFGDVPTLVVPATGVLSETAEIEGAHAAAGITWSIGRARVAVGASGEEVASKLGPGGSVFVLFGPEAPEASEIDAIAKGRAMVFGAAATADIQLVKNGEVDKGRVAAVRFEGVGVPVVEAATACRLISEPMVVTQAARQTLAEIDGEPALDVLSKKAGGGRHGGLILVALHQPNHEDAPLFRTVRGIDPSKRTVALSGEVKPGDRISFAVRDPGVSRTNLSESTRRAEDLTRGSQPTFALYLGCTGRGRSLYGDSDVDLRLIKKRFASIPIAGLQSGFQIVPRGDGAAAMQIMSGVLALFRAPS